MRRIYLLLAGLSLCLGSFAQGGSRFEVLTNADSLEINILHSRAGKGAAPMEKIQGQLQYDFNNQYPYYVGVDSVHINDTLAYSFEKIPDTGFLYVYSFDSENQSTFHEYIECKAVGILQTPPRFLYKFKKPGIYQICFVYTKQELKNPKRFIGAMEMTHGSFLFRQESAYDDRLIFPNKQWKFSESRFGLAFEPTLFAENRPDALLMYVELNVLEK